MVKTVWSVVRVLGSLVGAMLVVFGGFLGLLDYVGRGEIVKALGKTGEQTRILQGFASLPWWWVAAAFIVGVVLLAMPSISVELNARRIGDTREPRPVMRFDNVTFYESNIVGDDTKRVFVFTLISLTNRGMNSTFDRYELTLKRGGKDYPMRPCDIFFGLELDDQVFDLKDDLRTKAYPNPVATGAAVRGFLIFRVLDDSVKWADWETAMPGTQLKLTFKDCLDQTHHAKYTFRGLGGRLSYMPGISPSKREADANGK